jgi:hypothetical protein
VELTLSEDRNEGFFFLSAAMQAAALAEKKGVKGERERDEWVMEDRSGLLAGSTGQREHLLSITFSCCVPYVGVW